MSLFVLYIITSRREKEKLEQEKIAWKLAMKRKIFNAKHSKKNKRCDKPKAGRIITVAQANAKDETVTVSHNGNGTFAYEPIGNK